jgi:hypothetical protein
LCLRLSLQSPLHHFYSTCINCLIFLVMQVDLILNFSLWVCFNFISELQHAFLPSKYCELRSMLQFFFSFVVSLWDSPLDLLRNSMRNMVCICKHWIVWLYVVNCIFKHHKMFGLGFFQINTPHPCKNHIIFVSCPFWRILVAMGMRSKALHNVFELQKIWTLFKLFKLFKNLSVWSLDS